MSGKNLWGAIPDIDSIRTPHEILHEQGSHLSKMTGGLLDFEIERRQNSALFSYEFSGATKMNKPLLSISTRGFSVDAWEL